MIWDWYQYSKYAVIIVFIRCEAGDFESRGNEVLLFSLIQGDKISLYNE